MPRIFQSLFKKIDLGFLLSSSHILVFAFLTACVLYFISK